MQSDLKRKQVIWVEQASDNTFNLPPTHLPSHSITLTCYQAWKPMSLLLYITLSCYTINLTSSSHPPLIPWWSILEVAGERGGADSLRMKEGHDKAVRETLASSKGGFAQFLSHCLSLPLHASVGPATCGGAYDNDMTTRWGGRQKLKHGMAMHDDSCPWTTQQCRKKRTQGRGDDWWRRWLRWWTELGSSSTSRLSKAGRHNNLWQRCSPLERRREPIVELDSQIWWSSWVKPRAFSSLLTDDTKLSMRASTDMDQVGVEHGHISLFSLRNKEIIKEQAMDTKINVKNPLKEKIMIGKWILYSTKVQ